MAPRALKLGTRRSALARAQSEAIARALERQHPGLAVELVGIETRGDRILDKPLSSVEGKEFFTAELDAALLDGRVDLTVHSFKDLSLERSELLSLAAVPRREQPRDLALFTPDTLARLAAGEVLRIGSSSPRRAAFVPPFLEQALPRLGNQAPSVQLVELRGNVDSRLRRLHEPRGSARHLDGIVLAFAGLARLWADAAGHALLEPLLAPLPRMLLPLPLCPAAPAQGALAIECRRDDAYTAQLLSALDDAATRRSVAHERAMLGERGGGCHQRFGATELEVPDLGALLYWREAQEEHGALTLGAPQLRWTPEPALLVPRHPVHAWDGSRAPAPRTEPVAAGEAVALARLDHAQALFVSHRRAYPQSAPAVGVRTRVWVPGIDTWQALAARGVWVEGCAEGLGFASLASLLAEPLLQLPPLGRWCVLTHAEAAANWSGVEVIATYRHVASEAEAQGAPSPDATHLYWHSGAQFERWRECVGARAEHACGPGKTYEHLRRAGVHNLRMFPHPSQWREWLGL
jgi:hydroxymethylbilane synthase